MIVREFYKIREDGVVLHRTYSDNKMYIRKVGTDETYIDAIDALDYEYEETDRPIEEHIIKIMDETLE